MMPLRLHVLCCCSFFTFFMFLYDFFFLILLLTVIHFLFLMFCSRFFFSFPFFHSICTFILLGWETSEGTTPAGSSWRKNPIPRAPSAWMKYGTSFEPVCEENDECKNSHTTAPPPGTCKCSGEWNDQVEIMDKVEIPDNIKPGKYVLGWRWDCEESTQVWSSCSDVTITV